MLDYSGSNEQQLPNDADIIANASPYWQKLVNTTLTIDEKYDLVKRHGIEKDAQIEGYRKGYYTAMPDSDSGGFFDDETGSMVKFRSNNINNFDAVDSYGAVYGDENHKKSWNKLRSQPRMVAELVGKRVEDLTPDDFDNVKNYQTQQWYGSLTDPNYQFTRYDRTKKYDKLELPEGTKIPILYKVTSSGEKFNRNLVDIISGVTGRPVVFDAMQNPYLNVTNMPYIKGDRSEQTFDVYRALGTTENQKKLRELHTKAGADFVADVNSARDRSGIDFTERANKYIQKYEDGTNWFERLIDKFVYAGSNAGKSFEDMADRISRYTTSDNPEAEYIKKVAKESKANFYDDLIDNSTARKLMYRKAQLDYQNTVKKMMKAYDEGKDAEAAKNLLSAVGQGIMMLPEMLGESAAQMITSGAATAVGAKAGALAGTAVAPGVGTLVGSILGTIGGYLAGSLTIAADETLMSRDEYAKNNGGKRMSSSQILEEFGEQFAVAMPEVFLQKLGFKKAFQGTVVGKYLFKGDYKPMGVGSRVAHVGGSAVGEMGQEYAQNVISSYHQQNEQEKKSLAEIAKDPEQIAAALSGFVMGGGLAGASTVLGARSHAKIRSAMREAEKTATDYTPSFNKADNQVSATVIKEAEAVKVSATMSGDDKIKAYQDLHQKSLDPNLNIKAVEAIQRKKQEIAQALVHDLNTINDVELRRKNQDALFKSLGITREQYFKDAVYHSNYNADALFRQGKIATDEARENAKQELLKEAQMLGIPDMQATKLMQQVEYEVSSGPLGFNVYRDRLNSIINIIDTLEDKDKLKAQNEYKAVVNRLVSLLGNQQAKLADLVAAVEKIANGEARDITVRFRSGYSSFEVRGANVASEKSYNERNGVYAVMDSVEADIDDMEKILSAITERASKAKDSKGNKVFADTKSIIDQYNAGQAMASPDQSRVYYTSDKMKHLLNRFENAVTTIRDDLKKLYKEKHKNKKFEVGSITGKLERVADPKTRENVVLAFTQDVRNYLDEHGKEEILAELDRRFPKSQEKKQRIIDTLNNIDRANTDTQAKVDARTKAKEKVYEEVNQALSTYTKDSLEKTPVGDINKLTDISNKLLDLLRRFKEVSNNSDSDKETIKKLYDLIQIGQKRMDSLREDIRKQEEEKVKKAAEAKPETEAKTEEKVAEPKEEPVEEPKATLPMDGVRPKFAYKVGSKGGPIAATNSNNEVTIYVNERNNAFLQTIDDFLRYITGKDNTPTSKQKQIVFERLAKKGYGEKFFRDNLKTIQDIYTFILFHEKSHIRHDDRSCYYNNGKDLLTEDKIAIETRATEEAIEELALSKKQAPYEKTFGKSETKVETKSQTAKEIEDSIVNDIEFEHPVESEVVHAKESGYGTQTHMLPDGKTLYVYGGRGGTSGIGNPYNMNHNEAERQEVIRKCWSDPTWMEKVKTFITNEIKNHPEVTKVILGCWCKAKKAPKACHLDKVAELIKAISNKVIKKPTEQPKSKPTHKPLGTKESPLEIYTDGSDIKGEGKIGYGAVFVYNGKQYTLSGTNEDEVGQELQARFPDSKFSNPTMELFATARVLRFIADLGIGEHVRIVQDYKEVHNWLWDWAEDFPHKNKNKASNANKPYIAFIRDEAVKAIKEIEANGGSVSLKWINGHKGIELNEVADGLAKDRNSYNHLLEAYAQETPETQETPKEQPTQETVQPKQEKYVPFEKSDALDAYDKDSPNMLIFGNKKPSEALAEIEAEERSKMSEEELERLEEMSLYDDGGDNIAAESSRELDAAYDKRQDSRLQKAIKYLEGTEQLSTDEINTLITDLYNYASDNNIDRSSDENYFAHLLNAEYRYVREALEKRLETASQPITPVSESSTATVNDSQTNASDMTSDTENQVSSENPIQETSPNEKTEVSEETEEPTPKPITSFKGEYEFLSNDSEATTEDADESKKLVYRNAEAAYQASKFSDYKTRREFTNLTAAQARAKAEKLGLDERSLEEWNKNRTTILKNILWSKFTSNKKLTELLLATGDAKLINDAADDVDNELGKLLMGLREALKIERDTTTSRSLLNSSKNHSANFSASLNRTFRLSNEFKIGKADSLIAKDPSVYDNEFNNSHYEGRKSPKELFEELRLPVDKLDSPYDYMRHTIVSAPHLRLIYSIAIAKDEKGKAKTNAEGGIELDMEFNEITLKAIDFAVKEVMVSKRYGDLFKPFKLPDHRLASIFGLNESMLTYKQRRAIRNFIKINGVPRAIMADMIGTQVMKNLGIKVKDDEAHARYYSRTAFGLGMFALRYAEKLGVLKRTEYNKTEAQKADESYPIESDHIFCVQVEEAHETVINAIADVFKDKKDDQGNVTQEGLISQLKPNKDSHVDKGIRWKKPARVPKNMFVRNTDNLLPVPPKAKEVIEELYNQEYAINTEIVDFVRDNRELIEKYLGYKTDEQIAELYHSRQVGTEASNQTIKEQLQELLDAVNEYNKRIADGTLKDGDGGIFFEYFMSRNGRFFIDSDGLNPQTNKFQRFVCMPKAVYRTFDYSQEQTELEAFAVAQAFDNVKHSNEDILKIGQAMNALSIKQLEELRSDIFTLSEDAFKNKWNNLAGEGLGLKGIENLAQCLGVIQHFIAKKNANFGLFKTWLAVENDSTTSGYAIRFANMPLASMHKQMAKTGILIGDELLKYGDDKDIHELKARDDFDDLYESTAKDIKDDLDSLNPETDNGKETVEKTFRKFFTTPNESAVKFLTDTWEKLYQAMPRATKEKVSSALRTLMKSPTMVFGYSGGIKGISENMSYEVMDEFIQTYLDIKKVGMEEYIASNPSADKAKLASIMNTFTALEKVYIPRNGDNLEEALRTRDLDSIKLRVGSSRMDIERVFYMLIRPTYGKAVDEALDKNFSAYKKVNDLMNQAFITMFQWFNQLFKSATKDLKNPTIREVNEIVESLRDMFPSMPTAYGPSFEDGAMLFMKTAKPKGTNSDIAVSDPTGEIGVDEKGRPTLKSETGFANERSEFTTTAKAGAVGSIHWTDGAIMAAVLAKFVKKGITGIHDAIVTSALAHAEVTRYMNEEILKTCMDFDIFDTLTNRMLEVTKNYIKRTSENKDLNLDHITDIDTLLAAAKTDPDIARVLDEPIRGFDGKVKTVTVSKEKYEVPLKSFLEELGNMNTTIGMERKNAYNQKIVVVNVDGSNVAYTHHPEDMPVGTGEIQRIIEAVEPKWVKPQIEVQTETKTETTAQVNPQIEAITKEVNEAITYIDSFVDVDTKLDEVKHLSDKEKEDYLKKEPAIADLLELTNGDIASLFKGRITPIDKLSQEKEAQWLQTAKTLYNTIRRTDDINTKSQLVNLWNDLISSLDDFDAIIDMGEIDPRFYGKLKKMTYDTAPSATRVKTVSITQPTGPIPVQSSLIGDAPYKAKAERTIKLVNDTIEALDLSVDFDPIGRPDPSYEEILRVANTLKTLNRTIDSLTYTGYEHQLKALRKTFVGYLGDFDIFAYDGMFEGTEAFDILTEEMNIADPEIYGSNYMGYQTNGMILDTLERTVTDVAARAEFVQELHDMAIVDGHKTCSNRHIERLKNTIQMVNPTKIREFVIKLTKDGKLPKGPYNAGHLEVKDGKFTVRLAQDDRTDQVDPITRQSVYSGMSMAETYSHEVVHAGLHFAFTEHLNNRIKFSKEIRQLLELQKAAIGVITVEDFMPEDYDPSMESLHREHAQRTYDYIFNNPHKETLEGLKEFCAYGLTHERIVNKLASVKTPEKSIKFRNLADRLLYVVKGIFDIVFKGESLGSIFPLTSALISGTVTIKGGTIYDDLAQLTYKMSNADAKAARSLMAQAMKPVEHLFKLTNDLRLWGNKHLGAGVRWATTIGDRWNRTSTLNRRLGTSRWNDAAIVAKSLATLLVSANSRKVVKQVMTDIFQASQQGAIMSILNDITAPDMQSMRLQFLSMINRTIDNDAKSAEAISYKEISEKFGKKKLTELQESSLTYVGLFTDLQCLIDDNTTLDDVLNLVSNDTARHAQIEAFENTLKSNQNYNWLVTQARGLGLFMATGIGNAGQNLNAYNIARGILFDGTLHCTSDEEVLIDKLATLYALDLINPDHRRVFASLNKEGLDYFLSSHKSFVKSSNDGVSLDTGEVVRTISSSHVIKGYTKSLYDTSYDLQTGFEFDRKKFEDMGYELVKTLPKNKITGTKGLALYRRNFANPLRRDGAAVKIVGAHAMGTTLRQSAYTIASALNHNQYKPDDMWEVFMNEADAASQEVQKFAKRRPLTIEELKEFSSGYTPIISPITGEAVDYRVTMSTEDKVDLLGMDTRGITILSKMFASQEMKAKAPAVNKAVTDFLVANMENNMTANHRDITNNVKYTKITRYSDNKYLRESWNVIPKEIKDKAEKLEENNGDGLWVREDWLHDLFGVENYSITQSMPKDSWTRTKRIIAIAEYVMKTLTYVAKRNIVLFIPQVLIGNIASNYAFNVMNGTNPIKSLSYTLANFRAIRDYMDTKKQLEKIKFREKIGKATQTEINSKNTLETILERNRVHPLMKKGMYQAVVEDMNPDELENVGKVIKLIKNWKVAERVPAPLKWLVKNLYMAEGTFLYNFMFTLTQYSDFVARATEYQSKLEDIEKDTPKFLNNGRENPNWRDKEEQLSADIVREFINYDKPQSKGEQYLNDMGLLFFTKFAKRIQSVITDQITKNPMGVLMFLACQCTFLDVENIMEQHWLVKHWSALPHNPVTNLMSAVIPPYLHAYYGIR